MAKKKSGGATKKSGGAKKSGPPWTAQKILAFWKSELQIGLGTKVLDPSIFARYDPLLLGSIGTQLTKGAFDAKAEKATGKVAHDLGKICATLSNQQIIGGDLFDAVFALKDFHWACPLPTGGGGAWCDV